MREINSIIIHCTYTKSDMDIGAAEVRKWHVDENGWDDIGYHVIIRRDGEMDGGRPLADAGAHAKGHNANSIGIALVGGMSESGEPEANFTFKQYEALKNILTSMMAAYDVPARNVMGHNEVSKKDCPCINIPALVEGML